MNENMAKQSEAITTKVSENLSKIIEDQLKPIKQVNLENKMEIEKLKLKVRNLEIDTRKNNVIMHGVEEKENNNTELMDIVLEILNNTNKLINSSDWDKWEISQIQRIGKKDSSKTRPVKMTLTLGWRKLELLKHKKKFPKNLKITEDFTKEVLEARRTLMPKMIEAREAGKFAIIRNDKLIIREKVDKPINKEKRKRVPSSSPSTPQSNSSRPQTPQKEKYAQPTKLTKTNPPNATIKHVNPPNIPQSKN